MSPLSTFIAIIDLKTKSNKESSESQQMTYKEKQRWNIIEDEIMAQEEVIDQMKAQMAEYDFSTPESSENFQKLDDEFKLAENKLEKLMQEWESLSEKSPD